MFRDDTATSPETRHQPTIGNTVFSRSDLESLVRCYGANSSSYVLLEGQKRYFMSQRVRGFLAFEVCAGVAVIGGDPVCSPRSASALLEDFLRAVEPRPVCAYQVTKEMLPAFRQAGFDDAQIGNEAVFDPARFSLDGEEMETLRAKATYARRAGIRVSEHHPCAPGAGAINSQLQWINIRWMCWKGRREKGFLVGRLDLERRTAKRYFIARSGYGLGRVEAFILCEPIYGRNGYHLSIMRYHVNAPCGTVELLTTEIIERLADEGCSIASLGVAPLAGLDDPDLARHPRLTRLMRFAYDRLEGPDDFKTIYRNKAQYHPHAWEPRYLCFRPRISPRMVYATLQVRDAATIGERLRPPIKRAPADDSRREALNLKQRWQRRAASCKHAASLITGFCAALLLS